MRLSKILAIMFAAIFLVGCKGKGRDFDQFANGPSLASDNAAVSKMLSAGNIKGDQTAKWLLGRPIFPGAPEPTS